MFNQGHQQHGRVNGAGGRGLPTMMYNFQHPNPHQPQHTQQHHPNLQQDHSGAHTTNGIGHHTTFSAGVLSNSTPNFTPGMLQNGQGGTTRGGQAQQITEHWAEQLTQHKEAQKIHLSMSEQANANWFARNRAGENKGLQATPPAPDTGRSGEDEEEKDPARMAETGIVKRRQDWQKLDISGQGLRVLAPPLFNFDFLSELYICSNKLITLPPLFGQLRHLKILDASNNLLTILPPELGMCVYLEKLLLFDNQLRDIPPELGSLHKLEFLGIEGNDGFNAGLKQQLMENGTVSLITHLRETADGWFILLLVLLITANVFLVPPGPVKERELLDLQGGSAPSENQDRFKVFSYNILAGNACTTRAYGYSPAKSLSWEYRREKILEEIERENADIVCLQEIEKEVFNEYFCLKLAYTGYKGVFWSRSRAKTMSEKDQKTVDGCATFYKGAKFILLDKHGIEFATSAANRPDMKGARDIYNRLMPRDHIGLVTFFENRLTGSRLVVANTHIFWDPAYADVKLIQIAVLMQMLNKATEKYYKWPPCTNKKEYVMTEAETAKDAPPREPAPEPAPSKEYTSKIQLPLVICSDLNSTTESGVYELLSKGTVAPDHKELRGFEYGDFTKHGIEHPFQIRSAYTNLDKTPEALPFTNYTPGFRGVIDHIWYSTNALENVALLGPIDPEYMRGVPGFPNYHFPSDHISLVAEFSVKGKKEKKPHAEPDFGPSSRRDRRGD